MHSIEIGIDTAHEPKVVDLSRHIREFTRDRGDGLLSVFVPHATAGLAIIEVGAGSDRDLLTAIDSILPAEEGRWAHSHGSTGHGRDHVLPAFVRPDLTIPVKDGVPTLGTWQSVVLVDTNRDNPMRKVRLSFLPA